MTGGGSMMCTRVPIDFERYVERSRSGPCFLCQIADGELPHHMIYEDERAIVFLNKYPMLYGYTLVAPRTHREQVAGDFSEAEYLELQRLIYRVAEAIRRELRPERVYILSLGSQQANRHVHWHIAPLPPGVPYEEQQFEALRIEKGVLPLTDEEMAALAARIGARLRGDA
jgi:diadenosine tetraphosphate (Ap4A) HIT family hydrolase